MVQYKKYAKKQFGRAKQAAKKRYFKGGKVALNTAKIGQIMSDVQKLKLMVNAEKKRIDGGNEVPISVGAIGANLLDSGYFAQRQLFLVPEGTGHRQKNGNSIKCHSFHMDVRITQQTQLNELRGTMYVVRMREPQNVTSPDDLVSKFLVPSAFDDRYDEFSPRNYENMTDFTVVAKQKLFLPADDITGAGPTKNYSVGGRLNFHQRTKETAGINTVYDTNELAIIIVADKGSTLNNSGFKFEWKGTMYFYDN